MDTFHALADALFTRLAWTSAQAILLISLVWLASRLFPKLPAAVRSVLWWLLGVQLILGLTVTAPLELPLLSPTPSTISIASTSAHQSVMITPAGEAKVFMTVSSPRAVVNKPTAPTPASMAFIRTHWHLALMCLWFAGVCLQLIRMARDWRKANAVVRESRPLHDPLLQELCGEQARALGLRRTPALRVSHAIVSPQVMGLWHPTVLLPADHNLTTQESSLALAHELTHLRRGDLWLSWIPAIAQRLFFFHPLVSWAVREYALSREAACDAQVLQQTGTLPQAYGHLLLRLGVAHPMYSGLAGASPSFQNLKRRLTMLQQTDNLPRQRAHGWLLIALIAVAGVLPYRVTASSAAHPDIASTNANSPAAIQAIPSPPPPPPPASPLPPPPPPPTPPAPPPPPPPPPHADGFTAHHITIDTSAHSEQGFALLDGDSVTINGSEADVDMVKKLRKGNEPILWFRRGSNSYVVRDSAYIQRAKAIYAPINALGKQQGELGGQQGRLGGLQGGLGSRQGALGSRQGQLANEQAQLAIEQAALDSQPKNDKRQAELAAKQASLQTKEDDLARQQDELGKQQDALGKQQDALGAKQDALGKRQDQAVAQANRQIGKLIDEALAKGAAQAINSR
jgi:beta-lactamase regulating signal transducer with metallopeptidase domain